jgi:hypothetical protein
VSRLDERLRKLERRHGTAPELGRLVMFDARDVPSDASAAERFYEALTPPGVELVFFMPDNGRDPVSFSDRVAAQTSINSRGTNHRPRKGL